MRKNDSTETQWAIAVEETFGLDSLRLSRQDHQELRAGEVRVSLSHSAQAVA